MRKSIASLVLSAACMLVTACETPSGATCPPTDPPTYTGFAQPFFADYCLDCHSATSTNRHDAPSDQNFDTEADIKKHLDAIDTQAAAGPSAMNTGMPEKSANVQTLPTKMERELLGQYLACLKAQ
ncbi:MAG TPA: hypothetical protein VIV40_44415 [Kofleriaceae bacterium]